MYDDITAQRFRDNVDVRGDDECWPWLGPRRPSGYGNLTVDGKPIPATHIALELAGKPRPVGAMALHSCDNPPCCNDRHLRWGTGQDNADDRETRGRGVKTKGERHGRAKLTENDVRYIRTCGKSLSALSKEFGMSIGPLSMARSGKTWGHVT